MNLLMIEAFVESMTDDHQRGAFATSVPWAITSGKVASSTRGRWTALSDTGDMAFTG